MRSYSPIDIDIERTFIYTLDFLLPESNVANLWWWRALCLADSFTTYPHVEGEGGQMDVHRNNMVEAEFMFTLSRLLHKELYETWMNTPSPFFWSKYPVGRGRRQMSALENTRIEARFMRTLSVLVHRGLYREWISPLTYPFFAKYPTGKRTGSLPKRM